eukprot:JP448357.1.p3 GENE.JP448357.1~~JP448357.1.p3  ORF type:complete len:124 (+),score=36.71 JP448357.1:25-396(+)
MSGAEPLVSNTQQWKYGLLDFSDAKQFLLSWFCMPCQLGQNRAVMAGRKSFTDDIVTDFLPAFLCPICFAVVNREDIRNKYQIPGSTGEDIALLLFCGPCAMSQQTRELTEQGIPAQVFMDVK